MSSEAVRSSGNGKYLLVVDDDVHIASSLKLLFTARGYRVVTASTLKAGLAALESRPDVIILDVRLPDGSGVELARAAQALRPLPQIIVASGDAQPHESFRLARLGAIEFVPKPFDMADLDRVLDRTARDESDLERASRMAVGSLGLIEARDVVRESMTLEALAAANGNRSKAAEILNVTRQTVQAVMRRVDEDREDGE